jgi:hypothetical protein
MSVMGERIIVLVAAVIIVIICILVFAKPLGQIASSGTIGAFIADLLFWVPLGSITNVVTQPTAVIPA